MNALTAYIRANWHEVPEGIVIPDDVEFVAVWNRQGVVTHVGAGEPNERLRSSTPPGDVTRFTPEPLPVEPDFGLPTEPGYYTDTDGGLWGLNGSRWYMLGVEHGFRASEMSVFAPLTPVTLVPTETWDRLRVLDPEDERDRVDRDGDLMRFTTQSKAVWGDELAARNWRYGPLRFADEVSGDE